MNNNKDLEHAHQVTVVNNFRNNYTEEQGIIFSIPNGDYRHQSIAVRLKAEGLLAGIPDLCILKAGGDILFVEMKKLQGGTVSKEQKKIHPIMEKLGFKVIVCRGYEEAIKAIEAFMQDN